MPASPRAERNAKRAGSTSQVWGYVIVLTAALAFILSMYMMFFSKLLLFIDDYDDYNSGAPVKTQQTTGGDAPASGAAGDGILRVIERDVYYCYLVPLTIPVTFVACYANWVSLKFFRHN
uniref:Uncharacterized protein n=1 Tax=Globisporangium ultimum (strain ATCC 200006 / CBS 805.95 / DAOM BR144) TaxID=431595 RepID=K3X9E8_GLOUD